ncbi:hypothetical protein BGX28_006399 [Mortierella sp. GBA30]|nr:hypothetical protein BGX28_006399 [Mortierella sp. GBA30]
MGAGVSREHAKLPFGYTHARNDDHSCISSALATRRQRLVHRLLLIKASESTAISPLTAHRLLLVRDAANGEQPVFFSTRSLHSVSSGDEGDSDNEEIVSLNSILNEGPALRLQWHAVGQDQDQDEQQDRQQQPVQQIQLDQERRNDINGRFAVSVATTRLGTTTTFDTDSGHDSGIPHSRSTTFDSITHSAPSASQGHVWHSNVTCRREHETTAASCSSTGLGSRPFASAEIIARQDASEELSGMLTNIATGASNESSVTAVVALSSSPESNYFEEHSHQHQHLRSSQSQLFTRTRQHQPYDATGLEVTDDESDYGGDLKRGDSKMDLIAALGIADVPEDTPEQVSFDSFTEEPIFHHPQDLYGLHPSSSSSRRYNAGQYSGYKREEPAMDSDEYRFGDCPPRTFFEGYRDIEDEGLGDDMNTGTDDEDEGTWSTRMKKAKGKRRSSSSMLSYAAQSLLDYSTIMNVDEDVDHLSPIPFSELPSLTNIGLCSHGIIKLSKNIRLLSSATCLQLKLVDLKLSFNFLESVSPIIGELTKLTTLQLDNNRLEHIPAQVGRIKGLTHLNLENNPINILPAEISHLHHLRRLRLGHCPLAQEIVHSTVHSPPTLLELAARVVVRHKIPVSSLVPEHLRGYLKTFQRCTFCDGPYFEASFKRGKMIEKNDVLVPLEYTLCMPHWNTEAQRIKLLFGPRLITSPPLKLPPRSTLTHVTTSAAGSQTSTACPSRKSESSDTFSAADSLVGSPSPPPPSQTGSSHRNEELGPASSSSASTVPVGFAPTRHDQGMNHTSFVTGPQSDSLPSTPKSRFSIRLKPRGERTLVTSP